jgi:hypothetical protein
LRRQQSIRDTLSVFAAARACCKIGGFADGNGQWSAAMEAVMRDAGDCHDSPDFRAGAAVGQGCA